MIETKMIINGTSRESQQRVDVLNPATEEAFAHCHLSSIDDLNDAVAAARNAFPAWAATSDEHRKAKLMELASLMEANMPELMELVTKESGKPMGGLNGIGSGMEVGGAIAWIQATASLDLPVEVIQDDDEARIEVHRKPLGVVGSITPWNWPLMIAIWHVMPALRTGNTVVIKPSPFTPVATTRFFELANEVLPAGVLNVLHGDAEIGSGMSCHDGINKMIFTGSTPTGKRIMEAASVNLKRLTLELGGNDAGIVLPGADVAAIAPKLFGAGFHNNGQTCTALKRLYVHESQYEEMCSALAEQANNTVVGNGLDEASQLGPLQNAKQLEIVKSLLGSAISNNARIVAGGNEIDGPGYFFQPTIVADQSDGDRLVDEEQFGPVMPVIKYSDIEDVIERANRSSSGLGGSVWSDDIETAKEIASRLECGTVWVNEHSGIQPNAPFGGVKQSGFGVEFGLYGLEEYTSIQTLKIAK
ncbi:MAG: acyl-CoA reductase-like NAD-dependent aldehyde dehydrogenase [Arenicella sp.]|jgi:acyl-CoA reductase-like NAD-dependent aldehyde dehydrogenase